MSKTNTARTITATFARAISLAISLAITIIAIVKTCIFYGAEKFPHPLNSKIFGLIIGNFWGGDFAVWTEPYITVGILFILSIFAWATTAVILYYEKKAAK